MSEKSTTEPNLKSDPASNRTQGRFITLEGSEGAGKSTQLKAVKAWLESKGLPYVLTREPGGPPLAEAIRELLLNAKHDVVPEAELLLMFAARAQHVQTLIQPELAKGVWVISDRFTDSSYAYQGLGRGLDLKRIEYLESWVQGGLQPDLTLFYDISVEKGLARTQQRGEPDRIEQESIAFFERVRQGYHLRANADADRIKVIDASQSLDSVTADTNAQLDTFYESVSAHG